MRTGLALLLVLGAVGCESIEPVPIAASDVCFRCRRPITNTKLAAQVITGTGYVLNFRTAWCMASFLREQPQELQAVFVTDYATNQLFAAPSAAFVQAVINPDTNERDYLAFRSMADAGVLGLPPDAEPTDWPGLQARAQTQPKTY